eukprot:2993315-Amphidinium_carterae.2
MTRICEDGREELWRAPLFALAMMAILEFYVTSTRVVYVVMISWAFHPPKFFLRVRAKILYSHVDSRCTLDNVHTDWLAVGPRLWQAWASDRDHFLLHPTSDLESVTSRMATPDNVASY